MMLNSNPLEGRCDERTKPFSDTAAAFAPLSAGPRAAADPMGVIRLSARKA